MQAYFFGITLDEIPNSFASLTGDAVCVDFRADGNDEARVVWVNEAFTTLFGDAPEEVIGKGVSVVNDQAYYDEFSASIKPAFEADGCHFDGETYRRNKETQQVWTSMMIFAIPVKGGRFSPAIYRDLNGMRLRGKVAESAIKERDTAIVEVERVQDRLLTAMNGLDEPFVIWDENCELVVPNTVFAPSLINR